MLSIILWFKFYLVLCLIRSRFSFHDILFSPRYREQRKREREREREREMIFPNFIKKKVFLFPFHLFGFVFI